MDLPWKHRPDLRPVVKGVMDVKPRRHHSDSSIGIIGQVCGQDEEVINRTGILAIGFENRSEAVSKLVMYPPVTFDVSRLAQVVGGVECRRPSHGLVWVRPVLPS